MCYIPAYTERYSNNRVTCAIFHPIQKGTAVKRKLYVIIQPIQKDTAIKRMMSVIIQPLLIETATHTKRYSGEMVHICAIIQPIQKDTAVKA